MADRVPGDDEALAVIDAEISDKVANLSAASALAHATPTPRGALRSWVAGRFDHLVAHFLDLGARHRRARGGVDGDDEGGAEAMVRTGGPVARWISFPRGVRTITATTSGVALGLGLWGVAALAGTGSLPAIAGLAAGLGLSAASGPIGVRLANRLHRIVARHRRKKISELRGLADRRAVAVRGVIIAARTGQSLLDTRSVVWSLTRFRRGRSPLARSFFHEVACDFLLADGTDEPVWVEVAGGMLIDPFPPDCRVQFSNTTLLEIDHPFLTEMRLRGRQVRAAEISLAAGDVVEVVGRLSRRLDPTASSDWRREPPQRRVLRSGTRVPVMVRRIIEPDLDLARVRRLSPRGGPDSSSGEPPARRF
jgi:hypothetical protein